MSQEKAQLIAPLGVMAVEGVTASGVITATTLDGNIVGSAKSLVNGANVSVGVITATSFTGNLTGNIKRLADSAPDVDAGVTTATSFVGNLTGSVTDLTSAPAITVGMVTATTLEGSVTGNITGNITGNVSGVATGTVTGNVTGLAVSVTPGVNLGVGVCTAVELYGDGSTLTGAGSSAYIAQNITATGAETIINLEYGNLIYYTSSSNTTVGFASTAAAEQITFIRDTGNDYTITWPSTVTWNGGTTPTLIESDKSTSLQIFRFTTVDTGATYNAWEEMGYDADFTAGRVFVWGRNKFGSLGQNQANSELGQVSSPMQVGTEETWTSVGYKKGVKSDGTLWVWGENNNGMGLNDRTNRSSPTQVGTDSTWSSVNAGGWFKTDGSLWVVGYNGTGNLGQNDLIARSSPVQIPGTTWTTKIAAGNQHKIAIKSDGTLWGWGDQSDRGQLGQNSRAAISSPMQIGAGTDWSKVWNSPGGGYGSHAIKTDGTLWVWGNNYGALGLNENNGSRSSPTQLPGTNWKQTSMANSANSAYAVKTDGTLWAWGSNANYGNLGLNDLTNYSSPMQIGTDTDWSEPLAGAVGEVGALKTDDTLWMWGDSSYGGSGLNSNVKHSSPTQLPGKWVNIQGDGASSFTALRYSS